MHNSLCGSMIFGIGQCRNKGTICGSTERFRAFSMEIAMLFRVSKQIWIFNWMVNEYVSARVFIAWVAFQDMDI